VVDTAIKAVDAVPRAISENSRKNAVAHWTGRYVFSECRPDAPEACWKYDVVLDASGDANVLADGPNLAVHVVAKPEVDDGALQLPFHHYIDGNPDEGIHLPFQKHKGFPAGELLAVIRRLADGRSCLVFAALRSPAGSRGVCTASPPASP
jgi:hypothetical protein